MPPDVEKCSVNDDGDPSGESVHDGVVGYDVMMVRRRPRCLCGNLGHDLWRVVIIAVLRNDFLHDEARTTATGLGASKRWENKR